MRVAIPVWDNGLQIFENGGHAPFFAIFDLELQGDHLFKKSLQELRNNPKADPGHSKRCSDREDADCSKGQEGEDEYKAVDAEVVKPPLATSGGTHHRQSHHGKGHHHHSAQHAEENRKMGEVLQDCDHLLAAWLCGRSRAAVKKAGVEVNVFPDIQSADEMIALFLEKRAA